MTTNPDGSFIDEYQLLWKRATYDYYPSSMPLAEAVIDDLETVPWPDPYDPVRFINIRDQAVHFAEHSDYSVIADIMCRGPFELAVKLRGYEKAMTDFYLEPTFIQALLEKITDTSIILWDGYLNAIENRCQIVCQGDDLGMQTALLISPDIYRQFVKPCHKRIYDFIHTKTDAKIFMHSCGAIRDIIPDLIEVGVNILNPVQRAATGMNIADIKRDFGKDLVIWGGGIDTQQFLINASVNEIEDDIKKTMDILGPGGGFVFVPTHNLQPDVTPDRIDAVYKSALKYGGY